MYLVYKNKDTFEVLIKIKKIESILTDLAHRRIGYPRVRVKDVRRTKNTPAGSLPAVDPVRWGIFSRVLSQQLLLCRVIAERKVAPKLRI